VGTNLSTELQQRVKELAAEVEGLEEQAAAYEDKPPVRMSSLTAEEVRSPAAIELSNVSETPRGDAEEVRSKAAIELSTTNKVEISTTPELGAAPDLTPEQSSEIGCGAAPELAPEQASAGRRKDAPPFFCLLCICMLPGIVMLPIGLDVKGVTSNATPFVPLVTHCKITAVQHFRIGKDDSCQDKAPQYIKHCDCVACGEESGYPVSHIPGGGNLGHHRLLCRDFYTYTFDNDQDTGLKSVECSCRKLWDECKVNSTSQAPPRYQVGALAPCWKPRTTPLSGPTPPLPQCLDDRCYQTWDPTVKFSDMDKYGTSLMIAGAVLLPLGILCACCIFFSDDKEGQGGGGDGGGDGGGYFGGDGGDGGGGGGGDGGGGGGGD
jgi:uncharacterized membrane protein YgcG